MKISQHLLAAFALASCVSCTGCIVAGASSNGGFFVFPSIGVLFLILILFLVLRRR